MDSIIFINWSLLITNNVRSSKKPTFVPSPFLILLVIKKKPNIVNGNRHVDSFYWVHDQVEILGHFLTIFLIRQNNQNQHIFHGCYAIRFIICNGTFLTSSVHCQDFKRNYITMENTKSHDLILKKIYMLISVHL
jgi:hypothetical protein